MKLNSGLFTMKLSETTCLTSSFVSNLIRGSDGIKGDGSVCDNVDIHSYDAKDARSL